MRRSTDKHAISANGFVYAEKSWCVRGLCAVFTVTALVVGVAVPAKALVSFGKVATLNGNAATKDPGSQDTSASVATDGNGNWVAVWESNDSLGGTVGSDGEIFAAHSVDGARMWSFPTAVNSDAATDFDSEVGPHIATDAAGVWLAVWRNSGISLSGVARSTDNGASWTVPVSLPIATGTLVRIASLGGGHWIVIVSTTEDLGGLGPDRDLIVTRSLDDGDTWSAPTPLNTDAATDNQEDAMLFGFDLAGDDAGTLMAVWSRDDTVIVSSTSTDGGMTWSPPVTVSTLNNLPDGLVPSVATDGTGKWIVVWGSTDTLGGTIGSDSDILYSVSTDAGATWSAAAAVDPNAGSDLSFDLFPDVATDGGGNWYATWSANGEGVGIGNQNDFDDVVSRSTDGGVTWAAPFALNIDAGRDKTKNDFRAQLVFDGTLHWLTVWEASDTVSGTINGVDIFFATSDDDCPALPVASCKMPGKAVLAMKNKTGAGKDKLTWKWSKGDATSPMDIGNPETSSNYVLCLYDGTGGGQRVELEKDAPAASTCKKDKPCWSPTSKGEKYKDGRGENGAIKTIKINTGAAGITSVKVTAKGVALGLPRLPLSSTPGVTVQLTNLENGVCWQSDFTAAPIQNTTDGFKAKF